MNTIRIKICGITRTADALAAADAGADAVGLVFYDGSPRHVEIETARQIVAVLPPFVSAVGLFVNADKAQVTEVLQQVPLDMLQFHGDEPSEFCRSFHRPYIKAVRVKTTADIDTALNNYPDARALLLDAYCTTAYGGTGQCFDHSLLPAQIDRPWILAGGLNPDNIAQAICQTHAQAIDVSGGVEISKGIKDATKIAALVQAVRST